MQGDHGPFISILAGCWTLYETRTLEALSPEGYRDRLNAPTNRSGRMQRHSLNFVRSACVLSASAGIGVGSALVTLRLALEAEGLVRLEAEAHGLAHRLVSLPAITGGHVGVAVPDTTRVQTRESELRADTGEEVFGAVTRRALRCVERCCPSTRHAVRSDTSRTAMTCSMAARRRAALIASFKTLVL